MLWELFSLLLMGLLPVVLVTVLLFLRVGGHGDDATVVGCVGVIVSEVVGIGVAGGGGAVF